MDRIQIASKLLVVHIHQGNNTCPGCEPGLVTAEYREKIGAASAGDDEVQCLSGPSKERIRKKEVKEMKRKYGLEVGFLE